MKQSKPLTREDFVNWGKQGRAKSTRVLTSDEARAMVKAREDKRKTNGKLGA